MNNKYYVVAFGKYPGIYTSKQRALDYIYNFSCYRMRAFTDIYLATAYLNLYFNQPNHPSSTATKDKKSELLLHQKADEIRREFSRADLLNRIVNGDENIKMPNELPLVENLRACAKIEVTLPVETTEEEITAEVKTPKNKSKKSVAKKTEISAIPFKNTPIEEELEPVTMVRNWVIYTDGCYTKLAKPEKEVRGYSAILYFGHKGYPIILSGIADKGEALEMEMLAMVEALKRVDSYKAGGKVSIYSDCRALVNIAEDTADYNAWITRFGKKNDKARFSKYRNSLWKKLFKYKKKLGVHFYWIKGHVGEERNEWCDRLARMEVYLQTAGIEREMEIEREKPKDGSDKRKKQKANKEKAGKKEKLECDTVGS